MRGKKCERSSESDPRVGLRSGVAGYSVGGDAHIEGSLHLADPNEIVINGVAYQRSGSWSVTLPTLTKWENGYAVTTPIPDAQNNPPAGYDYVFTVLEGRNGSYWTTGRGRTPPTNLWVVSFSPMGSTVTIAWQLVKL